MTKPISVHYLASDDMHKYLFFFIMIAAGICQAETLSTPSGSQSEPMFMMPLSIVHAPEKERFEISYFYLNGSMIVNGSVNGTPMRFVVDTGASLVSIPPAIAEQAGIQSSDGKTVRLQTANGIVSAPLIEIDQVIADRVSITNVLGVVQQVSSEPDLGLLGMSFFGKHKMTIDHERNTIVLEPK